MAKFEGQKLKLLYIIKILEENTDKYHPISTKDLIDKLSAYGIKAERKSIYSDIYNLTEFGYDIHQVSSRNGGGYYLSTREFELPELKLLVDAVSASRFIPLKKSRDLIKKLESKAGKHNAQRLQRQVYVSNRVKSDNDNIYESIDAIHTAIQDNKKISFDYYDWNLKKQFEKRDDKRRVVSPRDLVWKDENYYLVALDDANGIIKHYRVDKVGKVKILDEKREGMEVFKDFDIAKYANHTFGMFSGAEETVTLRFSNKLIGVVIDRFGKDVDIRPVGKEYFRVRANVQLSGQFYGWLAGLGNDCLVVAPESVKDKYKSWLEVILESYERNE
ncbi:MAG: WYL domain-containing protein [Lachnospiraceae bacterium]|nr:WYL domain-containing protein [Lachnospiraceae bacterium]